MKGLLPHGIGFLGASLGWWLGAFVGFGTALFVSSIGTFAGMYYGRKWSL